MKAWPIWLIGISTIIIFSIYSLVLISSSWPIQNLSIYKASLFGDSFGFLNAIFTGGAFLLILWTLGIQQQELRLQKKEMARMVAAQQRQLHMELLRLAMEDSQLADVWDNSLTNHDEFKRIAYVNLILAQWEVLFKQGMLSEQQVAWHLNHYMKQSESFRQFWRRALPDRKEMAKMDPEAAVFHSLAEQAYNAANSKADHLNADH